MCMLDDVTREVTATKSEPFIGYRWFSVDETGFNDKNKKVTLGPVGHTSSGNPWKNKFVKANRKPTMTNDSGLHAFSSKGKAIADPGGDILGRVLMWGKCVEHENGLRSEFAQIDFLYPTEENNQIEVDIVSKKKDVFGISLDSYVRRTFRTIASKDPVFKGVKFAKLDHAKYDTNEGKLKKKTVKF